GRTAFHGPIKTLKVFEDNTLVRATLETPGEGRVLVVDGGGSTRCALFGGNLGQLAVKNKWAGVVVFGLIRDSDEIAAQDFGLNGRRTRRPKSGKGPYAAQQDRPVAFAGGTFRAGAWLYAEADGIVVSETATHG